MQVDGQGVLSQPALVAPVKHIPRHLPRHRCVFSYAFSRFDNVLRCGEQDSPALDVLAYSSVFARPRGANCNMAVHHKDSLEVLVSDAVAGHTKFASLLICGQ